MRLYKKAAAVLLAAAMAVSMMTACGGGAGGNGGNGGNGGSTGGGTEIVEPVPGPDTTDPDQGGETGGTTTQPEKTKIPDVTKSQYAQSSKKIYNSNEFYFLATMADYDANKTKTLEGQMIVARKGTDVYVKTVMTQEGKTQKNAVFAEKTNDGKYASYMLFEDDKTALKNIQNNPYMDFSEEEKLPNEMYRTTVKVGGKEYYAETYTDENGSEQTTCFGDNGMPKYQFSQRKDGTSETTVYQTIQIGKSNNLCQINGYMVYTMKNDAEGNRILVDESGNKYKVTSEFDQTTHKYTEVKVENSNGKDVTDDFEWFVKFFKG